MNRVQLITDGHRAYLDPVGGAFGADIDYAMLIKHCGEPVGVPGRHSPSECTGTELRRVEGRQDGKHVSTSYSERQNLTMRMSMRRFTRLTDAFPKKAENHAHMVALYTTWYNFIRHHKTLRVAPAVGAGLSDKLWSMEDVVALIDVWAAEPKTRGSYRPRTAKEG